MTIKLILLISGRCYQFTILDQHFDPGGQITATSVYLVIQRATCHCHGNHHALQKAAVLGVAKRVEQVAV